MAVVEEDSEGEEEEVASEVDEVTFTYASLLNNSIPVLCVIQVVEVEEEEWVIKIKDPFRSSEVKKFLLIKTESLFDSHTAHLVSVLFFVFLCPGIHLSKLLLYFFSFIVRCGDLSIMPT